jgi:hypothetical protein
MSGKNAAVRPLNIFVFCGIACLLAGIARAISRESLRSHRIFPTDSRGAATDAALFDNLKSERARYDDFVVKAKVSLKESGSSVLSDVLGLKAVSRAGVPGPKPSLIDFDLLVSSDGRKSPISERLHLNNYDALWIDYLDPGGDELNDFEAVFKLNDVKSGLSGVASSGNSIPRTLSVMDFSEERWVPKNYWYSLMRTLGLPGDENWRFTKWGPYTVTQRRMNQEISGADSLDLTVSNGTAVAAINLRIRSKGSWRPSQLVELGDSFDVYFDKDGKRIVRVHLREILEQLPDRDKPAYLDEISCFIFGNIGGIQSNPPVRRMVLQSNRNTPTFIGHPGVIYLPSRTEKLANKITRLAVDLRGLPLGSDFLLEKAAVRVRPGIAPRNASVIVRQISLVHFISQRIAKIVKRGENESRRLGGPFIDPLTHKTGYEFPIIDAYLPFDVFAGRIDGQEQHVDPSSASPPLRVEHNSFREQGVLITSDADVMRTKTIDGELLLSGIGDKLEILWPTSGRLFKDSRFYLSMPEGADQVARILLTITSTSGRIFDYKIAPNAAFMPALEMSELKSLKIAFEFKRAPFTAAIRELVLFHPRVVSVHDSISAELPEEVLIALAPLKPVALVAKSTGMLEDSERLPASSALSWTTAVNEHIDWLRGIRFAYPKRDAGENPCWLHLAFNWPGRRVERTYCLYADAGEAIIPAASFIDDPRRFPSGKLSSIDWSVAAPNVQPEGILSSSVRFDMALDGISRRSMRQILLAGAGLMAGRTPLSATSNQDVDSILYKPIRLIYDASALRKIAESDGKIHVRESDYLEIDSVDVSPRSRLSRKAWEGAFFARGATASRTAGKFKVIFGFALFGLMGAAFLKKRRNKAHDAVQSDVTAEVKSLLKRAGRSIGKYAVAIHMFVGLLAVVAALCIVSQRGWGAHELRLVSALMIILSGAIWNSLKIRTALAHRSNRWWFGEGAAAPHFHYFIELSVAGWFGWSLANTQGNPGMKYNSIPALAVIYFYVPYISGNLAGAASSIFQISRVGSLPLVAMFFLYSLGLFAAPFRGGNAPFILGSFAAAFALRDFLLNALSRGPYGNLLNGKSSGAIYYVCALVMLLLTAFASAFRINLLAEHLGVVVYFCLAIGVTKEIYDLYVETRARKPVVEERVPNAAP